MVIQCRVYQARNGSIYLSRGNGRAYTPLTLQQVTDLGLDLYSLDDFSLENFKKAYHTAQSLQDASDGEYSQGL